jgi:MFS family permease
MNAFRIVLSIWPLFFGLTLIGISIGMQGSLLGIRAELENFNDFLIGLLMSSYFGGFLLGSLLAPKHIRRVGHIRIFGALSAVASITILLHALFINPWIWMLMRFLSGFAFSTIYVVSESWLNKASSNSDRGQILSIYATTLLLGICIGQFLLTIADPFKIDLFILISLIISIAAIPILLSGVKGPSIEEGDRITIKLLWRRTRIGVFAIALSQWVASIVFSMGAVYAIKIGFNQNQTAYFMGCLMMGGMFLQWPLGKLSDKFDRRWIIGLSSIFGAFCSILILFCDKPNLFFYLSTFLFGGFSLSLYSIIVAFTNDHLRPNEITSASGTIILIGGLASMIGPLTSVLWFTKFGAETLFLMFTYSLFLVGIISIYRVLTIPALPRRYKVDSTIQVAPTPIGTILSQDSEIQ